MTKEYLKRQFANFEEARLDKKLSKIEVIDGVSGSTLIVPSECKDNWKPNSTSNTSLYTEGATTNGYYTSNLINNAGKDTVYKMNITEIPSYFRLFCYNADGIYKAGMDGNVSSLAIDSDGYVIFTNTTSYPTFAIIVNMALDWENLVLDTEDNFVAESTSTVTKIDSLVLADKERTKSVPNVLKGKKWVVCGDSFTAGSGLESTISSGRYEGKTPVYPYVIGNRNDMDIRLMAKGGKTLATPAVVTGSTPNFFSSEYTSVPVDADYITLYFGINDSHSAPNSTGSDGEVIGGEIPLGTISDNTINTFYGAWNVVLPWLIANRPNAKIGIIVSNGCDTDDYRVATIECAKKWGIPYIDLNGDERTPAMLRTTNPNMAQAVKNALLSKWRVSSSNAHPNEAAHAFESTIIENFLRGL